MPTRDELKAILLGHPVSEVRSILGEIEVEYGVDLSPIHPEVMRASPAYGAPIYEDDWQYVVELQKVPEAHLPVILVVRQTLGLGLREALDMVKRAPQVIKRFDHEYEAKELVSAFEEAGATAVIHRVGA